MGPVLADLRLWCGIGNRVPESSVEGESVLDFLRFGGGAFEYCTSWFMEAAFGITAWDYTGRWLSIDGRTSGQFMFFWGLIGVVWVKWLLPRLLALINRIPWKVRYSLTAVCTVLMVIDIAFTLMALDCWYGRMAGQPQDSPVAMWFSERYSDAYMANRFQTMHIDPSKAGRM